MLTLITGGARSGKSNFAQSLCLQGTEVVYIATALPCDQEMRARITRHRASRPAWWLTIEEPIAVAEVAGRHASSRNVILIDCLTVWFSNSLFEWRNDSPLVVERKAHEQVAELISISKRGNVIAVTNEVGSGIVPESSVARQFRDIQGFINQRVAEAADAVYLLVSGIPLLIKPSPGLPQ
jgi:adenosylcobinamide kinase / adenosylcobinamide-phosphate guanylyltransferase